MILSFSLEELSEGAKDVYQFMPATPQYVWPLLCELTGANVRVKHENHTPTGAFKARGGITYIPWLKKAFPEVTGVITATRGNHGQSQALAASQNGLTATIVVPKGNSVEKNAAMKAFGAELIEFGDDFDEARVEAMRLVEEKKLHMVPAFHPELVRGVATYGLELFTAAPELDVVYVPIGCGSGVCGVIQARDALGLKTKIIGVVSTEALAVKLSFEQGRMVETKTANTFADGMAVRVPVEQAFEIYSRGMERVVAVSEEEIAEAVRAYYRCTHNLAEGAGAAALAALLQERDQMRGKAVGVILTGGNIDQPMMADILSNRTPAVC